MHIVVVTTGLKAGGAESVLLQLVQQWLNVGHTITIMSLSSQEHLDNHFAALKVVVKNYNLKSIYGFPRGFIQLVQDLKSVKPDIVQTWMPHADLIGGIAAKFVTFAPIIWGCHHSDFSLNNLKLSTFLICKLNAVLSYVLPKKVIAVSSHSRTRLIKTGFNRDKIIVVQNGIDSDHFKELQGAKGRICKELEISHRKKLVGFVGRLSSEKRVEDFLLLAALLTETRNDLHFVMVGDGHSFESEEYRKLVSRYFSGQNLSALGVRYDMPELYSAFDVLVSTSNDEAFGMVLIEALACGCACVSSDNRAAQNIAEHFIELVTIGDVQRYADAVVRSLKKKQDEKEKFSAQSSAFVKLNYSIEKVASSYLDIYNESL